MTITQGKHSYIALSDNVMAQLSTSALYDSVCRLPYRGFFAVKILVLGDLMLDRYCDGCVERISPEAPVPILAVRRRRAVAGGAANVAMNVGGLKATVVIAGVVGDDQAGDELIHILQQSGIDIRGIIKSTERPTTCKTRITSGTQQMMRLDEEVTSSLDNADEEELVRRVLSVIEDGVDAVILSDYAKGVLTRKCPALVIEECNRKGLPVFVDPKRQDFTAYAGATCITPNIKELKVATTGATWPESNLLEKGNLLRESLRCKALLVTQGAEGMTLLTDRQTQHLPALAEEVFDVSGAGDTVIATLATALGGGLAYRQAIELANAAASIVVAKLGTSPIVWEELRMLMTEKYPGLYVIS
jgi:D-beta-D-heptose 7-phosphate kinase/D-beta-D-heptose 1-phosphate adenosyltransferase